MAIRFGEGFARKAAVAMFLTSTAAHGSAVFINEFHYDNSGTDTGEAIEIAGPAGTNLGSWDLVLYNGANQQVYNTTNLSGVIPDQQNGFGTLSFAFPTNGIQNGAPDGFALVDNGSVVQFLSYEGDFTAADGVANGLTSTDVGVTESSGTAAGNSLQLVGFGTQSTDFVWTGPDPDSFGDPNAVQTFGDLQSLLGLVINEVDYDQAGTDTAEFIELLNNSDELIDLSLYSLQYVNGANDSIYRTLDLPDVMLGSGEYFVICGDATNVVNCDFDAGVPTNFIQNGAPDGLALVVADSIVNGGLGTAIVDALSYEGDTTGVVEGSGAGLVDIPSVDYLGLSRISNGMDTDQNNVDFSPRCVTPGYANSTQRTDCPEPSEIPVPPTLLLLALGLVTLRLGIRNQRLPV